MDMNGCPNKDCEKEPLKALGYTVSYVWLVGCPKCRQVYFLMTKNEQPATTADLKLT